MRYGVVVWLFTAVWFVPVAQAQGLPSTLSFGFGGDEGGSRDRYFDLDYALNKNRLLFSLASNHSDSLGNPITTDNVLLGFRTDPLARISGGVDLEHWGEKDTLVTDTFRAVMDINLQHWQVSFRPQWRKLTFIRNCIVCDHEVEIGSSGAAFDVSYFSDGPWSFSLGFARNEYDSLIDVMAQYPVFASLVFSAAAMELATGLEERRGSIGVSYFSGENLWSFSRLKSVSKLTGEASFINTLRFSTELNAQWRLSLRLGSQTLEDSDERVGFSGIGLAYSW